MWKLYCRVNYPPHFFCFCHILFCWRIRISRSNAGTTWAWNQSSDSI